MKDEYASPYDNWRFGLITGLVAITFIVSISLTIGFWRKDYQTEIQTLQAQLRERKPFFCEDKCFSAGSRNYTLEAYQNCMAECLGLEPYEEPIILMNGLYIVARVAPPVGEQVLGVLAETDSDIFLVMECESGGNPDAVGKAGEIGLFQYLQGTWDYFNELRGTDLYIHNSIHQIDMTKWAFNNGLQCHWVCYRMLYPGECP